MPKDRKLENLPADDLEALTTRKRIGTASPTIPRPPTKATRFSRMSSEPMRKKRTTSSPRTTTIPIRKVTRRCRTIVRSAASRAGIVVKAKGPQNRSNCVLTRFRNAARLSAVERSMS